MAYVSPDASLAGTELLLDAPGGRLAVAVTEIPFRPRAGT